MAKRKLNKQQRQRIQENQAAQEVSGKTGLLVARYGKRADVQLEGGKVERCNIRQNLPPLVVGDLVIYQHEDTGSNVIVALLPRCSELSRIGFREQKKLIAANLNQLIIVIAGKPEFSFLILDSYLAAAELSGIHPVVLFNKVDLFTVEELQKFKDETKVYRDIGYDCFYISCLNEADLGFLTEQVKDKRSAFVGPSGAGKSSLIKHLLPHEEIALGEVSEDTQLGKHTTTTAQLFHLPAGGSVIDSPGVRGFSLGEITKEQLFKAFVEMKPFQGECRFKDCKHQGDLGCALQQAVQDGKIAAFRLANAQKLLGQSNHE
jgi:ribosome biogenesis GTPase